MSETREEMLARHARELAELEARWWWQLFTEDPYESWMRSPGIAVMQWCRNTLPTIIRKREKVGLVIQREGAHYVCWPLDGMARYVQSEIPTYIAEILAGRPLATGERVEI